ncbi:hypothetical protein R3P38DRAFT_3074992 [Favolaschia claudopus]|uniref:Uncharacterized protein n=1 Tax=Favolaschia claudopus TaxID=2862362 RepID=A0AAV9ZX20_9AGAR
MLTRKRRRDEASSQPPQPEEPKGPEDPEEPEVDIIALINKLSKKKSNLSEEQFAALEAGINNVEDSQLALLNPPMERAQLDSLLAQVRTGKGLRKKHRAQLRTAAPCWGRVFPNISEVEGGREGWLMVMAGIIIPRLERKPAEPITDISAEAELLRRIPIIGTASQDAGLILRGVQELADTMYRGIYQVHPKPILFIDQKNKAAHKGIEYEPFSTFTGFINTSPQGCIVSIALVVLWESSPVGKKVVRWMGEDMHANIVLMIHPRAGRGKAIAVGEPNIDSLRASLPNPLSGRMTAMLKKSENVPLNAWCNQPRKEINTGPNCLPMALEWMIEIVAGGLPRLGVERDEKGGVKGISGFRVLNL